MVYMGHIINGKVVLDSSPTLPEGAAVCVLLQTKQNMANEFSLRGTPYEYDDPFAPAINPEEWEANR
jgi:hypothetical protein